MDGPRRAAEATGPGADATDNSGLAEVADALHRLGRLVAPARPVVGVCAIGLHAYWAQFPGLRERLLGYAHAVVDRLSAMAEVVDAGMVDTEGAGRQAGDQFARAGVDLTIVHAATYAASAQVLPVVQRAGAPVLVLNLQPAARLDYEHADTAEWLAHCSACCVPEIAGALARCGVPFRVVSGTLAGPHSEPAWAEIQGWCQAAGVRRSLRDARIGFLGHTYPGMLDMYTDFTQHHRLGLHVDVLEMEDLAAEVEAVRPDEAEAVLTLTHRMFQVDASVVPDELGWAARVAAGMERLVRAHELTGLAYYYRGRGPSEDLGAALILGGSLLTARGVPCAGEGDLKNCVAMMVLDRLACGGSYTEIYAMDLAEGFVLMGHDGPGHLAISRRRPVLRGLGLYHGKAGRGVSVEFSVRTGPVTILCLTQTADGRFRFIVAEGRSRPGPVLRIGNTNSRIHFPLEPADFMSAWCAHGPTHHVALAVGHVAGEIGKVGDILGIETVRV